MIEEYKEFIKKYKTVGTAVGYLNKENQLETVCTGFKSLENKEMTTKDTIYRIASISKVIVAIGLLKLYEKGLISLDEDISVYLGFEVRNPKYVSDKITLRMIMTQTSSITDEGMICENVAYGYDGSNQTDEYIPLRDLLTVSGKNYCKETFSDFKPGTNFQYSNLGCGILACVIEKIAGIAFTEYIKRELLLPLNIYSGFRLEDIKNKENLASHYLYNGRFVLYRDYEKFKKVQCVDYPLGDNYRGVAGGLYISLFDLSKIMQMLINKGTYENIKILEEATIEEMEKVQWEGKCSDPTYHKKGLQIIIMDEFTEKPLFGHFGNAYGLRSFMLFNEDGGIIFLCNGADFLSDEEHMTLLQKEVIDFLLKKTNMRK